MFLLCSLTLQLALACPDTPDKVLKKALSKVSAMSPEHQSRALVKRARVAFVEGDMEEVQRLHRQFDNIPFEDSVPDENGASNADVVLNQVLMDVLAMDHPEQDILMELKGDRHAKTETLKFILSLPKPAQTADKLGFIEGPTYLTLDELATVEERLVTLAKYHRQAANQVLDNIMIEDSSSLLGRELLDQPRFLALADELGIMLSTNLAKIFRRLEDPQEEWSLVIQPNRLLAAILRTPDLGDQQKLAQVLHDKGFGDLAFEPELVTERFESHLLPLLQSIPDAQVQILLETQVGDETLREVARARGFVQEKKVFALPPRPKPVPMPSKEAFKFSEKAQKPPPAKPRAKLVRSNNNPKPSDKKADLKLVD